MQDATHCPMDVLGWIPWYPDEGLGDAERGAVEAHAAACARCRAELALVLGEEEPAPLAPAEAEHLFAGVMARVAAAEPAVARAPERRGHAAPPPRRASLAAGRALAAAAGVAALCLLTAAGGALVAGRLSEPVYVAATAPRPVGEGPLVDVVFREDASAARIGEALRRAGGEIVAGPTELGRYRVKLSAGGDPAEVARVLVAEEGVALFAEPLRP
jgi:anti-sigma factor RsiW